MQGEERLRDLLSLEVVATLNEALCARHADACPPSDTLAQECAKARHPKQHGSTALLA